MYKIGNKIVVNSDFFIKSVQVEEDINTTIIEVKLNIKNDYLIHFIYLDVLMKDATGINQIILDDLEKYKI